MSTACITEFVVKIASRCNLNCDYCYEYNLGDESYKTQPRFMSYEIFERLSERIYQHVETHGLSEITIGFHGGEPLLAGASRLNHYCQTIRDKIPRTVKLNLGIQTNGILLTADIISVISKHSILVSVSLDGDRVASDRHRRYKNGKSSHNAVLHGVQLLQRNAPDSLVGALAVIDLENDPLEAFDALAALNVTNLDFLLPHHNWDNPPSRPNGSATSYADWYFTLFEAWISDRHPTIRIRFLENIVSQLAGGPSVFEAMTLAPPSLIVIASDGSIEAVDCIKSTASGIQQTGLNIRSATFDQALVAEIIAIRNSGSNQLSESCHRCQFRETCAGGYFPHRWSAEKQFNNPSIYCADLYSLIGRIADRLAKLTGGVS